ncbi:M56 family metallopeptidase [Flavilitoribacter nigricans]|uniref:Peptidase M56 domain-containing protein n=1 Tax=Flavilitoribacter nigricans (strain ATCC 23147 / DSM 23189 / NBRC 102662 / NCIMB 1420 / SS-2) TaxID=1122177 RepID=A0A2D0NDG2_FLAN2|nr:M56 family metallopeptidase [Flavilitoribacter nigricans]PHN06406.1 hypothetical protein CRP01_12620 [Flavilitoribacter nigricans DSM 23189 = NBRC 102662]
MITLLLKISLCLALLYGFFWLLLRKSTFYQINRGVLLAIAFVSLTLPLIEFPANWDVKFPVEFSSGWSEIGLPQDVAATTTAQAAEEAIVVEKPAGKARGRVGLLLAGIYCLGLLWYLFRTGLELNNLRRLIKSGTPERFGPFTLIRVPLSIPPLAFFRYVVVHPGGHSDQELHHILQHEQVHVREWHTLDILFMEVFTAVLWFHPLAWQLKRQVKLNLEFIADRAVLSAGNDRKNYQLDLLKISVPDAMVRSVNHFNYSHIKTRIVMMNRKRSSRLFLLNYFSFLPLTLLLLLAFQSTVSGQEVQVNVSDSDMVLDLEPGQSIYMKISGELSEKDVNTIFLRLEKTGVDLDGTKVEYNRQGEITRISFHAAFGGQHHVVESYNNGRVINEPLIFYYTRDKGNKVVVGVGTPKSLDPEERRTFSKFTGIMVGTFSSE